MLGKRAEAREQQRARRRQLPLPTAADGASAEQHVRARDEIDARGHHRRGVE